MLLCTLIFKFLGNRLQDKRFCTEWQQAFLDFNLLLISSWIEFLFVKVFPKYLKSSTLSKELLSIFILWLRPALWSRDIIMYLVLSASTSSPTSLLATTKASEFFFILCTLPLNILTSSSLTRSCYQFLTFHVPNLTSLFLYLCRTKLSVQVRGLLLEYLVTGYVLRWGFVSTSPNPQARGPPLVDCQRLLIKL